MAFEKGHTGKGGRTKGVKNGEGKQKQRLIRYHPKKWDTSYRNSTYDIEIIEHLINNNLPIDDYIDKLNSKWDPAKRKRNNNDKNL